MFLDDFDTYLERSQIMRRTGRYYQIVECLNGNIMEPFYQEELKKEKEKNQNTALPPTLRVLCGVRISKQGSTHTDRSGRGLRRASDSHLVFLEM